jgi:hypothetical protein
MDVALVGIMGDLVGRSAMFKLATSFSKTYRWCHICTGNRTDPRAKDSVLRNTAVMKEQGKLISKLQSEGAESIKKVWKKVSSD